MYGEWTMSQCTKAYPIRALVVYVYYWPNKHVCEHMWIWNVCCYAAVHQKWVEHYRPSLERSIKFTYEDIVCVQSFWFRDLHSQIIHDFACLVYNVIYEHQSPFFTHFAFACTVYVCKLYTAYMICNLIWPSQNISFHRAMVIINPNQGMIDTLIFIFIGSILDQRNRGFHFFFVLTKINHHLRFRNNAKSSKTKRKLYVLVSHCE